MGTSRSAARASEDLRHIPLLGVSRESMSKGVNGLHWTAQGPIRRGQGDLWQGLAFSLWHNKVSGQRLLPHWGKC